MTKFTVIHDDLFENLPDTWGYGPFGEYVDFQEGPGILAKDFHETGVPLLRLKSIESSTATLTGCNFLNPEKVESKWSHFKLSMGDLLLSSSASLGRVSEVDESTAGAVAYTGIIRMRPSNALMTKGFIRYFLQSRLFSHQIERSATGSVIKHFGPMHLKQMGITLPPIEDQKAIAHILGTLDDKIELNQKMNQILEEIAKAIFKSWFVDFDPVRAKAEGRPTGLPPEIGDLFPDELVDSEIGEIPKGWQTSTFADVLEIQGGFAFKSKDFGEDGDRVIKIKNIRGDGTVDQFDCDRVANADKKLDRFLLRDGDAVIAMTGATVGKVGLMSVNDEKFYLNQRVGRLLPKSSSDRCWYSVLLLSSEKTKDFIEGYAYGSAQPNISSKDIASIPNVTSCSELVESFNQFVSPLFLRTLIILKENDLLSELRDTLLPKLISGELRIPDAEKFLEEAGI